MSEDFESQGEAKKGKGKKQDFRGRVAAFLVYPDSAYPDWQSRLRALHVRGFISPLHDQDVLADGSPKKAHWHVMLFFEGKKSRDQIDLIREAAIGPAFNRGLEDVHTPGAYARYLIHLDDPEKAQYRADDVICLGGADYALASAMPGDESATMAEISAYIVSAGIASANSLIAVCKEEGRRDWLTYISRHGYVIGMLIGHNVKRLDRIRLGQALPDDFGKKDGGDGAVAATKGWNRF